MDSITYLKHFFTVLTGEDCAHVKLENFSNENVHADVLSKMEDITPNLSKMAIKRYLSYQEKFYDSRSPLSALDTFNLLYSIVVMDGKNRRYLNQKALAGDNFQKDSRKASKLRQMGHRILRQYLLLLPDKESFLKAIRSMGKVAKSQSSLIPLSIEPSLFFEVFSGKVARLLKAKENKFATLIDTLRCCDIFLNRKHLRDMKIRDTESFVFPIVKAGRKPKISLMDHEEYAIRETTVDGKVVKAIPRKQAKNAIQKNWSAGNWYRINALDFFSLSLYLAWNKSGSISMVRVARKVENMFINRGGAARKRKELFNYTSRIIAPIQHKAVRMKKGGVQLKKIPKRAPIFKKR